MSKQIVKMINNILLLCFHLIKSLLPFNDPVSDMTFNLQMRNYNTRGFMPASTLECAELEESLFPMHTEGSYLSHLASHQSPLSCFRAVSLEVPPMLLLILCLLSCFHCSFSTRFIFYTSCCLLAFLAWERDSRADRTDNTKLLSCKRQVKMISLLGKLGY